MNNITADTVRHIAKLARIKINDEEKLVPELSAILGFVGQPQKLNTDDTPPMTTPAAGKTPLRPDTVAADASTQDILRNAPKQQDSLFVVPKIIGDNEPQ